MILYMSRVLVGIEVAIVRHIRRITYTPKLTLTFCEYMLHGARIKSNVRGAHCKQHKILSG